MGSSDRVSSLDPALRQRLLPGGVLLLADMVRHDSESHAEHMRRNLARVRRWADVMGAQASQAIYDHVASSDRPADLQELMAQARAAGAPAVFTSVRQSSLPTAS